MKHRLYGNTHSLEVSNVKIVQNRCLFCCQDLEVECVALLNDTVGCLMSCAFLDHDTRIGVILGKKNYAFLWLSSYCLYQLYCFSRYYYCWNSEPKAVLKQLGNWVSFSWKYWWLVDNFLACDVLVVLCKWPIDWNRQLVYWCITQCAHNYVYLYRRHWRIYILFGPFNRQALLIF